MIQAIFGIVGVLIGAGITVLLDTRRARRDDAKQAQSEVRELRRAVRLVLEELGNNVALLDEARHSGRFWDPDRALATADWTEWRRPLALLLQDVETWEEIQIAFRHANRINWYVREEARGLADWDRKVANVAAVAEAIDVSEQAMKRMYALLGEDHWNVGTPPLGTG